MARKWERTRCPRPARRSHRRWAAAAPGPSCPRRRLPRPQPLRSTASQAARPCASAFPLAFAALLRFASHHLLHFRSFSPDICRCTASARSCWWLTGCRRHGKASTSARYRPRRRALAHGGAFSSHVRLTFSSPVAQFWLVCGSCAARSPPHVRARLSGAGRTMARARSSRRASSASNPRWRLSSLPARRTRSSGRAQRRPVRLA